MYNMILCLILFILTSCQSINNVDNLFIHKKDKFIQISNNNIVYNKFILQENETKISFTNGYSLEEIFIKAINTNSLKYLNSQGKNYKRNIIVEYDYYYDTNDDFEAITMVTYGILGLFGIPYQAITSNIQLNVKVETIDGIFIKEYGTNSKHTEYVAPYYGYSSQTKAITVSKSKAFQKAIFNILEQITNDDLELLQEEVLQNKKEEEEKIQNEIKQQKIKEQQRKVRLIKRYGTKLANIILNKQIFIGMPESALIESWGQPNNVNRDVYSWSVFKQYVYDNAYVYVENGVVSSWQEEYLNKNNEDMSYLRELAERRVTNDIANETIKINVAKDNIGAKMDSNSLIEQLIQ